MGTGLTNENIEGSSIALKSVTNILNILSFWQYQRNSQYWRKRKKEIHSIGEKKKFTVLEKKKKSEKTEPFFIIEQILMKLKRLRLIYEVIIFLDYY